jgi:solute carrier family 30 (zinc transporter), member 9
MACGRESCVAVVMERLRIGRLWSRLACSWRASRPNRCSSTIISRAMCAKPSPDTNIAKMFRIVDPSKMREISSDYPRPTTQDELTSKKLESSKQTVYLALGGNMVITLSKTAVWISTGSSAMLSEAIHSLVDSGNQALLLIGLRGAETAPDSRFQYGYGKSVYFWSLVSALGTFWCGAGISMWNSGSTLINPSLALHSVGWETWGVLGVAFAVDGTVLFKTLQKVYQTKPAGVDLLSHIRSIRDPTMQAVLMEDAAACGGVLIAVLGIGSAQATGLVVLDSLAGMAIAGVLGAMGLYLARLNQKYLMGQSVGTEITTGIKNILLSQESIDEVHSVQSQWVGPYSFSYKAEIDFDGTYIAAKLMNR